MHPLVSFIVPSYNREKILEKVLGELSSHRFPFHTEVIVIDNNSIDGSIPMVKRFFPGVRLIPLAENIGAVSRNMALQEACGKYVVMLDDDSYPTGDSIETGVEIFEKNENDNIGCIAFNIRRPEGFYETAGIYCNFTGCGAMFRKDIFSVVGGYPADYLFYVEEYDLSARLWQHGYRILNFRELEVMHLKTNINRDFSRNLSRLVKNNMLLWSKYLPPEMAKRQIAMELWRYEKIGLKENASDGFFLGKQQGEVHVDKYAKDRQFEVSVETANILLDLPNISNVVSNIKMRMKGSKVLIFNIGKLLTYLVEEIKNTDIEIVGIVDDNVYMQMDTFEGIQIFSRERFSRNDYDAVIIGSSSLAINDELEKYLLSSGITVPYSRLCEYNKLNEYM